MAFLRPGSYGRPPLLRDVNGGLGRLIHFRHAVSQVLLVRMVHVLFQCFPADMS